MPKEQYYANNKLIESRGREWDIKKKNSLRHGGRCATQGRTLVDRNTKDNCSWLCNSCFCSLKAGQVASSVAWPARLQVTLALMASLLMQFLPQASTADALVCDNSFNKNLTYYLCLVYNAAYS
jgi:hypothetical protein